MKKCFDAGQIQAFLDGELTGDLSEQIACHIADCDPCALALAEAEEETAVAFSLLDAEFNTLVPTQRLWTKINGSIEQAKPRYFGMSVFESFKLLFANPSIAAFAGLVIVAGVFSLLLNPGASVDESSVAQNNQPKLETTVSAKIAEPITATGSNGVGDESVYVLTKAPVKTKTDNFRAVKANFVKPSEAKVSKRSLTQKGKGLENSQPVTLETAETENLPGETTYIKTIAALEKTVDTRKDQVLKPSARFSYEKDLAVANDAILKMKSEVQKNPKNAAAQQVLMASYQNKIELLNTVAEKTDLMASLR